jgi:hypothetical protein
MGFVTTTENKLNDITFNFTGDIDSYIAAAINEL